MPDKAHFGGWPTGGSHAGRKHLRPRTATRKLVDQPLGVSQSSDGHLRVSGFVDVDDPVLQRSFR